MLTVDFLAEIVGVLLEELLVLEHVSNSGGDGYCFELFKVSLALATASLHSASVAWGTLPLTS